MAGIGSQELFILGTILFLWILPGLWIYRDAEQRGASAVGWLIAWFVGWLAALLIWLIVRPPRTARTAPPVGRHELER